MEQFRQVIKDMKESVITKASSEELINTWADVAAKQVNDSLTLASEEVKDWKSNSGCESSKIGGGR